MTISIIPNWTIILQLAFFLTCIWVCTNKLFPPIIKVLQHRRKMLEGAKTELRRREEEGEQMRQQYEEKLRVARLKGQDERNRYRTEAAEEERALLETARAEATEIMYKGQKQVEMIREQTVEQLDQEVQNMAKIMAEKILGRSIET